MEEKALTTKSPFTQAQVTLIKDTVAKGSTNDELKLFMYTCNKTGLDPLTRQIHFVKRNFKKKDGTWGQQMTIQTGIDGYRSIAERTGTLAGIDDAVYDSEEGERPTKATVTVWRKVQGERVGFTASARWAEYFPGEKQGFMWKKMPYLMLAKCAEALALRKAFPNNLSGIYTNEEMAQAGDTPKPEPTEEEVTDIVDADSNYSNKRTEVEVVNPVDNKTEKVADNSEPTADEIADSLPQDMNTEKKSNHREQMEEGMNQAKQN